MKYIFLWVLWALFVGAPAAADTLPSPPVAPPVAPPANVIGTVTVTGNVAVSTAPPSRPTGLSRRTVAEIVEERIAAAKASGRFLTEADIDAIKKAARQEVALAVIAASAPLSPDGALPTMAAAATTGATGFTVSAEGDVSYWFQGGPVAAQWSSIGETAQISGAEKSTSPFVVPSPHLSPSLPAEVSSTPQWGKRIASALAGAAVGAGMGYGGSLLVVEGQDGAVDVYRGGGLMPILGGVAGAALGLAVAW